MGKEKTDNNKKSFLDRIEGNCSFTAIRHGMISIIPLMVIASIALMIISLPIPAYQDFINGIFDGKVVELLDFIYSGVFDAFAIILAVATSISYSIKKQKQMQQPINISDILVLTLITLASLVATLGIQYEDFSVSMLSNLNTITALFVSLVSAKMFYGIKKIKFFKYINRGTVNDNIYTGAIEGLIPAIVIIGFFSVFRLLFEFVFNVDSLQELFVIAANNMLNAVDNNFGEGLVIIFMTHIMWFFGIHGNNVLQPIVENKYTDISASIYTKTFQDSFVIIGGCGTVLCLVLAILIFSRKKNIRNIASLASSTVIFNISEIVAFGLPVILNPTFLVPFLCLPIFNYLVSYATVYLDLVPNVTNQVEWATPIILNAYQATGSWRGILLQIALITVGTLVYKPFVDLFEKQNDKRFSEDVKELVELLKRDEENNKEVVYTELQDEYGNIARLLANELEEAVEKKELFLVYQPQVDANDICVGGEALIRWKHPLADYIYPPLIIKLAREKGFLYKVEKFIIESACKDIHRIEEEVDVDFKISVNLTNGSLEWDGLEECIARNVSKYDVPNNRLWLEITERDAISSSVDTIEKIQNLKNKGHKFLIDDFGMGHTSLLYLQTNQFDVLKLDGILTKDILENKRNSKIVEVIAQLGSSLKVDIIAEYVTTREQRDELVEMGCYAFQGNLYSVPIKIDEFIVWMKEHSGKGLEINSEM